MANCLRVFNAEDAKDAEILGKKDPNKNSTLSPLSAVGWALDSRAERIAGVGESRLEDAVEDQDAIALPAMGAVAAIMACRYNRPGLYT